MDKKWIAKWIMDPRFASLIPLDVHHKEASPHKHPGHAVTDRTWSYRIAQEVQRADAIGYNTQFQEHIDSRLMARGWRSAGFDDSDWQPVLEHPADDHRFRLQPTRQGHHLL